METYGRGFDQSNLWYMNKFFLSFPILDAVRHKLPGESGEKMLSGYSLSKFLRPELSWTHYRLLFESEHKLNHTKIK